MTEVPLDPRRPLAPAEALAFANDGRRPRLGVVPVEFEVSEFGVRHQRAVDEQAGPDPGTEGQHDDDTGTATPGPESHLGDSRGVGIVDHRHGEPTRLA